MTEAQFTDFLVRCGLSAADGRQTLEQLVAMYGTGSWYEFSPVVRLPQSPLFPENTQPYWVSLRDPVRLPPDGFSCDFDVFGDGRKNYELALDRFWNQFGKGDDVAAVNTLSQEWSFGRARLRIRVFLRGKTPGDSPLYKKYPELWHHCRITIERNWLPDLTAAECTWMAALASQDLLEFPAKHARGRSGPDWDRGFLRENPGLEARKEVRFWRTERELGFYFEDLVAIYPRAACAGLELDRVFPARGGGYSVMCVALRNPFSIAGEVVRSKVLTGAEATSLDRAAKRLPQFWGLPLNVADGSDD